MKIFVCLRQVPDTGARLQLKENGDGIEESNIEWIINPYDEFALEEALRIRERKGNTEVVVLSQGPARVEKALRQALAMGADKACWIKQETGDTYPAGTARTLHKALAQESKWDMILIGKTSVDENHFALGPMLAELLNVPHAGFVSQLTEKENGQWLCERHREQGITETITLALPALVTVEKGINQPRYPSLPGIMQAKKKPVKTITCSELNKEKAQNPALGPDRVFFESYRLPDPPPSAHFITGSEEEQAKTLIRLLKEKQLI